VKPITTTPAAPAVLRSTCIACTSVLLLHLAGCATAPADPSKLTEGQLRALAADRSALASCSTTNTPWGPFRTTLVQLDRATIPSGEVSIGADCTVTIRTEAAPKPAPRAAP
jgi:hypothetical protein